MARLSLCAWVVLTLLTSCAPRPPVQPYTMPVGPILGEFTVFERWHDGFIESQRHGGMITIERIEGDDAGYRVSCEPDLIFLVDPRYPNLTLTRDPLQANQIAVPQITFRDAGSGRPPVPYQVPVPIHKQSVVVIGYSFHELFLVRGVGPAYWADVPTNLPPGVERIEDWDGNKWAYQRRFKFKGSRSERLTGELTYDGKPIEHAEPGTILFTPLGKFIYFGPTDLGYTNGWLNTLQHNIRLFKDDGSLTVVGFERRASLRGEVLPTPSGIMSQEQLNVILADVKKGMTREEVRAAVDEHFKDSGLVTVHADMDLPDGGAIVETYNLYNENGSGAFILRYQPNVPRGPPDPDKDWTPHVSTITPLAYE